MNFSRDFGVILNPVNEVVPLLDVRSHPCLEVLIPERHLDDPVNHNLHPLEVVLVFKDCLREELVKPHVNLLGISL